MRTIIFLILMAAAVRAQDASSLVQYVTAATGRLPAGYRECTYLESSGTQYINTGYNNTGYTAFDVVYSRVAAVNFGHVVASDERYCWRGNSSDAFLVVNYNSSTQVSLGAHPGNGVIITGHMDYDNAILNGTTTAVTAHTHTPYIANQPICIFGHATLPKSTSRIYSFKITEVGVLKRDMIPALDASNVPCFYDLVTGATKYNVGTGNFSYQLKP